MSDNYMVYATLAAAIIRNMNRPVSLNEAERIFKDVEFSFNPNPGGGAYQMWEKETDRDKAYE